MKPLYSTIVRTDHGPKTISVYNCNVLDFDEDIDILTTSAFVRSYEPSPRTLFNALHRVGISVKKYAASPIMDLRDLCNVWLSAEILHSNTRIRRIGCVEMNKYRMFRPQVSDEQSLPITIRSYFQMLDIAATHGIKMDTVALPLLGSGNQQISSRLLMFPIINECLAFLKRNDAVKRICFIEMNPEKADLISFTLQTSYLLNRATAPVSAPAAYKADTLAFISYSSDDKTVADQLCARLESKGIRVWYAPRDVSGAYADAIVQAIEQATLFIVILSRHSMQSEHVLNEIDLAFQKLPDRIRFKPVRIDDSPFTPSFRYYLSRQHWIDASTPPLDSRLDEFADFISTDV